MVDFSNPDELRRWLPAQPRELGIALAARSALRVLPMIGLQSATVGTGPLLRSDTFNVQTCFRCLSTAWIAFGPYLGDRRLRIGVRARSAAAVTPQIGTLFTTPAALAARRSAAEAARFVASTGPSSFESLVNAITAAYLAEPFPDLSKPRPNACASAMAGDVEFLAGRDPKLLSDVPLWLNRPPAWAEPRWRDLKITLTKARQDWQVWTTWYDDRLDGRVRSIEREVAYVNVLDEVWGRDSAEVNKEIIRRIEEHEPPPQPMRPPDMLVGDLPTIVAESKPALDLTRMGNVERWLADKPHDVAVVFAARAALRVTPQLFFALEPTINQKSRSGRYLILPTFRAMAASWVAGKFPNGGVLRAAAAAYAYAYAYAGTARGAANTYAGADAAAAAAAAAAIATDAYANAPADAYDAAFAAARLFAYDDVYSYRPLDDPYASEEAANDGYTTTSPTLPPPTRA